MTIEPSGETSFPHNELREFFEDAIINTRTRSSFNKDFIVIDYDERKSKLGIMVSRLREAHKQGKIPSIEGIPTREEVATYDPEQTDRLTSIFNKKYFQSMIGL